MGRTDFTGASFPRRNLSRPPPGAPGVCTGAVDIAGQDWGFLSVFCVMRRGFGKTRTLAEWVCDQVASGQAGRIALVAATAADAREERYSFRRTAMVSAGIRALETPADLAQWSNRNDINFLCSEQPKLEASVRYGEGPPLQA